MFFKTSLRIRFFAFCYFLSVFSGHGQGTFRYTVELNGSNVVPANSSTATATGTFALSGQSLTYVINWTTNIGPTSLEIHGPAMPGENAVSLYTLVGSIAPPAGLPYRHGVIQISANQITDLNGGLWYLNFHTAAFPNGEIRGQIVAVPEPSIICLFGLGAFVLYLKSPRRRHPCGATSSLDVHNGP